MLEQRTVLKMIEVHADGVVFAKFDKEVVKDGKVLTSEPHRTSVPPGTGVEEQMAAVNQHLAAMDCAPCADYSLLSAHAKLAHTPKVIKAYAEKMASIEVEVVAKSKPA